MKEMQESGVLEKRRALVYIAVAACLWGIISLFIRQLYATGFTPTQVVSIRALSATFFLFSYALYKNRQLLRIKPADSRYFIGTGVISIVLFNWCMFSALQETSVSVVTILLYTAPAFVLLFSRILFKESLTRRKLLALCITLLGCTLVAGVWPDTSLAVSGQGLLLGLGAGFFYALYSIFGKYALQKYDSLTVTVYTFMFAALAITPFSGLWQNLSLFSNSTTWGAIAGLGFLSTTLAYLLYTKGLAKIEAGRASIIATLEPVVASLLSLFLFEEYLSAWQYGGILLVLAAVVLVHKPAPKKK